MERLVQEIMSCMLDNFGLDTSVYNESHVKNTILDWIKEYKIGSKKEFCDVIKSKPNKIEAFMNSLSNQYSKFFRNPKMFLMLRRRLFDRLVNKENRHPLRVWVIGCSKGQEPYSIAMVIENILRDNEIDIEYSIFASDIQKDVIEQAKKGVYHSKDIENVTYKDLKRYFDEIDGTFEVKDIIKKNLVFSIHDIVFDPRKYPAESIYGSFDYVFINNVMIYYNEDIQKEIANKVVQSCNGEGCVVTSEAESALFEVDYLFEKVTTGVPIFPVGVKE